MNSVNNSQSQNVFILGRSLLSVDTLWFSIEFFNNSDAILNFEHIAMHCGLSRVILPF